VVDKVRLSFGGRWSHDYKYLANGFLAFPPGSANFSKFTPKVGIDYRPSSDAMVYASWSRGYRSGGFSPRAATPTMPPSRSSPKRSIPMKWAPSLTCSTTA
jgi:iron complex outermembrane receptor protein